MTARVRPTKMQYGLNIAFTAAERSDCSRRQVGAAVFGPDGRILSTGYNGYPSGKPPCGSEGGCPRGRFSYDDIPKDSSYVGGPVTCMAFHAEENAILYARRDLDGCTLFTTHAPCPNCQRFILGTRLKYVIVAGPDYQIDNNDYVTHDVDEWRNTL